MSIKAIALVWERSRAKGSNFLMLLGIADYAKDDGRWAWPSAQTLGWKSRLTGRAGRQILEKLVDEGEVWPEWDAVERRLYLHLRCVCDWAAYQQEGLRPDREWEKISDSQREKFSLRLAQLGAERHVARRAVAEKRKIVLVPSSSTDPLDPSEEDPSERERAREARPPLPPIEAYVDVWNGTTTLPIPRCDTITANRRRLLEVVRLKCPPPVWAEICAKVEAAPFLRGANTRKWKASLDWLLKNDDAIAQVLEGHFDDNTPTRRPPGPGLATAFECPHDPACHGRSACQLKTDLAKAKAS